MTNEPKENEYLNERRRLEDLNVDEFAAYRDESVNVMEELLKKEFRIADKYRVDYDAAVMLCMNVLTTAMVEGGFKHLETEDKHDNS